jgi:hypothetical protein
MKTYLVIQTADIEIVRLDVHETKGTAEKQFEAITDEEKLIELEFDEIGNELTGTLRIAGDDSACVQLVERELFRENVED